MHYMPILDEIAPTNKGRHTIVLAMLMQTSLNVVTPNSCQEASTAVDQTMSHMWRWSSSNSKRTDLVFKGQRLGVWGWVVLTASPRVEELQ
jgi:hypothetical protein